MARTGKPINYRLELKGTSESTGYFGVVPETLPSFEEGLAYLRQHPNDSFMVTHLLECVGQMSVPDVLALLDSAEKADATLRALILEAASVYDHLSAIKKRFTRREMKTLAGTDAAGFSPL